MKPVYVDPTRPRKVACPNCGDVGVIFKEELEDESVLCWECSCQFPITTEKPIEGMGPSTSVFTEGTEAVVCADIMRRQQLGMAKYGQSVFDNPLPLEQWLQHAYEETLDNAIYLKRAMQEIARRKEDK